MALKYLLFESSSGYGLFECKEVEQIADMTDEFQSSIKEFSAFNKMVSLKGFMPFLSAESALSNINDVTEGILNDDLKSFLEGQGLPTVKKGKKAKFSLGVGDAKLGGSIKDATQVDCVSNEKVLELLRGVRQHLVKFLKGLEHGDLERSQVGLGHSYSRSKVKFNIHRADNMIIQAIAILDQIDKDINTFAMRIKEWYSWHFPELVKCVPDIKHYVKVVNCIQNKKSLLRDDAKHDELLESCEGDQDMFKSIIAAAKSSMGADLSEVDMLNVTSFGERVISLLQYRDSLSNYLSERMNAVAPNLTALIGELVGARLISKAGSLTNLAKAPASTVQILGAEKALFRALKTKGNTPKYGLIFHSSFIGRASAKNKGRISRYLANKCSISSRIDCFSDELTSEYGRLMKEQVEERLEFFNSGKVPRKNLDVMAEVKKNLASTTKIDDDEEMPAEPEKPKSKKKKRKAEEDEGEDEEETPKKKKKKDKGDDDTPKKKSKKSKKKSKSDK